MNPTRAVPSAAATAVGLVFLLVSGTAQFVIDDPAALTEWVPRPKEPSLTYAFFHDTETAVLADSANGTFTAEFSTASNCVFWANNTAGQNVFKITGSDHYFESCLHSNQDMDLGGSRHEFNRTLRYNRTYNNNSNEHVLHQGVVNVPVEAYPFRFEVSDYAPGTPRANQAQSQGKYHYHAAAVTIHDGNVAEGLWYVDGAVTYKPFGFTGNITLVSTGVITMSSENDDVHPYIDGLLALTSRAGPNTIKASPVNGNVEGALYAIDGEVSFAGQSVDYAGAVIGAKITISGSNSRFTAKAPPEFS